MRFLAPPLPFLFVCHAQRAPGSRDPARKRHGEAAHALTYRHAFCWCPFVSPEAGSELSNVRFTSQVKRMERAVPFHDGSGNLHRPARRSIVPSRAGPVPQKTWFWTLRLKSRPSSLLLQPICSASWPRSLTRKASRALQQLPLRAVLLRTNHCVKHCSRC